MVYKAVIFKTRFSVCTYNGGTILRFPEINQEHIDSQKILAVDIFFFFLPKLCGFTINFNNYIIYITIKVM